MIKIVFMGTPEIAVNTLSQLSKKTDIKLLGVVTPLDKPQGRKMILTPPPVKKFASENGLQVFQTKSIRKDENLIKELKEFQPDFFVTFAFGQILSQEVLDIPKFGTINIHASLLPKYRGANPIQHAIFNGDKLTGITTMLTSLGLDEGDICLTEDIEISKNMTDIDLRNKISEISPDLLYKTLTGLYNKEISPTKQNNDVATYANKFQKADGFITFDDKAENLHNKIRALLSWPTCYFEYQNKKIKILSSEVVGIKEKNIGEILEINKNGIVVSTKMGGLLLKEIQPESKNKMSAYAWNNSARLKVGDFLC